MQEGVVLATDIAVHRSGGTEEIEKNRLGRAALTSCSRNGCFQPGQHEDDSAILGFWNDEACHFRRIIIRERDVNPAAGHYHGLTLGL